MTVAVTGAVGVGAGFLRASRGRSRRWCNRGRGGTFGLGDGVDGEAHEGTLKFGRGQGSGMRGEFEDPASEGQQPKWKFYWRGVAGAECELKAPTRTGARRLPLFRASRMDTSPLQQ